jgi:hypothetical protein
LFCAARDIDNNRPRLNRIRIEINNNFGDQALLTKFHSFEEQVRVSFRLDHEINMLSLRIILFVLALLVGQFCFGQDVIITYSNDTIDCSIIKIDDDFIHFSLTEYGESTTSKIPIGRVANYTDNFVNDKLEEITIVQPESEQNVDTLNLVTQTLESKSIKPKLRLAINFGPSYVLTWNESVPAGFEQYYRNLSLGAQLNSNLAF